jgi:hypothetical protein
MSDTFAAMNVGQNLHVAINATRAKKFKLLEPKLAIKKSREKAIGFKVEKTTSVSLQKELQFKIESEKVQWRLDGV